MALDERYQARAGRAASLQFEIQSLLQQDQALLRNAILFEGDLSLRTVKLASITSCLANLDSRRTATTDILSDVTSNRDRYNCT